MLGSKRDPIFPDVPTATELGFPVALDLWRGIAVPKGTPKAAIDRLETAIKHSVESEAFKEAGDSLGFTPAFLPSDGFEKLIASDDRRLAEVMADLGLKKSK
jgi:tripartite-type tricarboxylate transporter receptor subunit TctC